MPGPNLTLGAACISLAALIIAAMAAAASWASAAFSTEMILFMRWMVGMALFAILVLSHRGLHSMRSERSLALIGLGLSYVTSVYALYLSLRWVPLVDALVLFNTAPLFAPFWERLFLGRSSCASCWAGVALGFVGVVVVLAPSMDVGWRLLLPLAAGLLMSIRMLLSQILQPTEPKERMAFYVLAVGLVVTAVGAVMLGSHPSNWQAESPAWAVSRLPAPGENSLTWGAFVFMGVGTLLVPLLTAIGYRHGGVAQLGVFRYTGVIFAALLEWLIWAQAPKLTTWIGFVVILCGAALVLRQHAHQKAAVKA